MSDRPKAGPLTVQTAKSGVPVVYASATARIDQSGALIVTRDEGRGFTAYAPHAWFTVRNTPNPKEGTE